MSPLPTLLRDHVESGDRLAVIKAPPGSGKTHLLVEIAALAVGLGMRIAIGAQTNTQADDICVRLAREYPGLVTVRFASASAPPRDLGPGVGWETASRDLPGGASMVVGTVAKWGLVDLHEPFDLLFIDEAWQMSWADFMLTGQVSERFVLIGDPGQISPVVTIPVERWEMSPRAPHRAAPSLILQDPAIERLEGTIDVCRRLPFDTVEFVRAFYDFPFEPVAQPGDRYVKVRGTGNGHALDPALKSLGDVSVAAVTVRTDPEGPPFEVDDAVARVAADVVHRLLDRGADIADGLSEATIKPQDIGIAATHRVMNSAIADALGGLRSEVRVDTPERWQGLERKVMVVVHPLSGVAVPNDFDLSTGRLCVMASRHRSGLVLVSRDHISRTLDDYIPSAEQPLGRQDIVGRGHSEHHAFWERLTDGGVVALSA